MRSFPLHRDRLLGLVLRGAAALTAAISVLVVAFLLVESFPAWRSIGAWRFLGDDGWHPAPAAADGSFELVPMLAGTLAATAGAVIVAGPLGVLSAVFCRFYAPRPIAGWYRRLLELLAGIPSVVYGFWGLSSLAPLVRRLEPPGTSLLTGIVVLAIMILPTVALLADAAIAGLPAGHLRAAAGLGLSRWGTVRGVVLPAVRPGLAVALGLATARALGETMAVLMVCGNVVKIPASLFDPVRTLTANIALELGYAAGDHRAALFASGLVLLGLIMILVLAAPAPGRRDG